MTLARRRVRRVLPTALAGLTLLACTLEPSPTPEPTPTDSPTVAPTTPAIETASPTATPVPATPTPTPEPTLSLEPPAESDERRVTVSVAVDVPADGDGRIDVTVVSGADSMITELVLRWPEGLHETLFPAPFEPSEERIREGGQPLVQPWTKWVIGPGERGEPDGTVSLGYGPLVAGGTLEIPLFVTRRQAGPVAFDLQVLAGEALLSAEGGDPAVLRIEVP